MDGVINFLKSSSMTSHDAVTFFRKLTGIKKIGHTGTLDPMAVGVLPICIGKATRLIEYMQDDKAYRAVMKLGIESETGDIWGKELRECHVPESLDINDIETCLKNFEGRIQQRVPGFSAQKHKGKKLYEYARAGDDIPEKYKCVYINKITVVSYQPDKKEVMFDVECSKGTYIRTICTDLGRQLGSGGVMSYLLRTGAGGLNVKDSVTMKKLEQEMEQTGNIDKYLMNPADFMTGMKQVILSGREAKLFINGIAVDRDTEENADYAVLIEHKEIINSKQIDNPKLIGIGTGRNNKLKPKKVIFPGVVNGDI